MTTEERRQNWQQFARSSEELLAHPETPVNLFETIARFLEAIVIEGEAPAYFRWRLEAMPDVIDPGSAPRRRSLDWTGLEDEAMEFGDALGRILADEMTPQRVREACEDFSARLAEWASRADPEAGKQHYCRLMLPGLLILAAGNTEAPDEQTPMPTRPTESR